MDALDSISQKGKLGRPALPATGLTIVAPFQELHFESFFIRRCNESSHSAPDPDVARTVQRFVGSNMAADAKADLLRQYT